MEQNESFFQLSEPGEQVVRTYECTRLRHFLAPVTIGHLTVTNKRVIFHSKGKSLLGKSILINEMPLEDTAGITAYLDISINWLFFAVFCVMLYLVTLFLKNNMQFLGSWWFAVLLMLPFSLVWILESELINEKIRKAVFKWFEDNFEGKINLEDHIPTLFPIFRIVFLVGAAILGYNLAFADFLYAFPAFSFILLILIYLGIFLYSIGRQRTFNLTIGSKTRKGSGIFIPGTSLLILLTRDSTAPDTLGASPAKDAEKVIQELGAMLMDIRQLGDLGIQKWIAQ
jgi:hypothetical protein